MVTFFLVILLNVMIVSSTHRHVKGALSDLIAFLETENPLKMLVLKIFKRLSCRFGHV